MTQDMKRTAPRPWKRTNWYLVRDEVRILPMRWVKPFQKKNRFLNSCGPFSVRFEG